MDITAANMTITIQPFPIILKRKVGGFLVERMISDPPFFKPSIKSKNWNLNWNQTVFKKCLAILAIQQTNVPKLAESNITVSQTFAKYLQTVLLASQPSVPNVFPILSQVEDAHIQHNVLLAPFVFTASAEDRVERISLWWRINVSIMRALGVCLLDAWRTNVPVLSLNVALSSKGKTIYAVNVHWGRP